MKTPGTLYIVSTPIGNLEDITLRALRILKEVDLIAAEDTRHTRKLLSAYDIHTRLTSYFEHNEAQKSAYIVAQLADGKSVALVSDAGTPGISDPGYPLIAAAIHAGIPVVPIPGASAMLTALSVSGLPTDHFLFIGFLTNKRSERIQQLQAIRETPHTVICYASPHHFLNSLADIRDILGQRRIVATRELTKSYEEVVRGDIDIVIEYFEQKPSIKGEFTLVIAGAHATPNAEIAPETILTELTRCIEEQQMSRKDAVKQVAAALGVPKNLVYKLSLNDYKQII